MPIRRINHFANRGEGGANGGRADRLDHGQQLIPRSDADGCRMLAPILGEAA